MDIDVISSDSIQDTSYGEEVQKEDFEEKTSSISSFAKKRIEASVHPAGSLKAPVVLCASSREENRRDWDWEWDAGLGWDHKNGDSFKNDRKELDVGVTASHKNEKGDTDMKGSVTFGRDNQGNMSGRVDIGSKY